MLRRAALQGPASCRAINSALCPARTISAVTMSQRSTATTSMAVDRVAQRKELPDASCYGGPMGSRRHKSTRAGRDEEKPRRLMQLDRPPKSWIRKNGKAADDPSLSEPLQPKQMAVVVRNIAAKFMADTKTAKQILGWGIAGRGLELLASHVIENEAVRKSWRDDHDRMTDLLLQWWDEAVQPLGQAVLEHKDSEFWSAAALLNIQREHLDGEVPRQCTTSFLSWLERKILEAKSSASIDNKDVNYLATHITALMKLVDMRFPSLQANNARSMVRNIHLHVGPTNSGKTHGALVALCKARTGLYAGPLRLLAHEVWDRINSGTVSPGVPARPCNLLTGEESRVVDPEAGLQSCTVEMVNPETMLDVAVLDEIQMIADPQRGYAWTAVVLSLGAKELHLCGENSVVPLIKRMAEACGDKVHVHTYERLTPLEVGESLESWSNIRKGDCVVAFSRNGIFRLKEMIERSTGLKCAVAYGALPPETKAEQAKLFNDPTNDIDVMVASDAIGMGLNLKIKRVIFSEVTKWNGEAQVQVSFSQMKQIAGRAGRYGTGSGNDAEAPGGIATTYKKQDLKILREALAAPLKQITRASIELDPQRFDKLSTLLPATRTAKPYFGMHRNNEETAVTKRSPRTLQTLLKDVSLLMRIDTSMYFTSASEQQSELAHKIEGALPHQANLTLHERSQFANSPTNTRDEKLMVLLGNMVRRYARGQLITFESVEDGLGLLEALESVEAAETRMTPPSSDVRDEHSTGAPQEEETGKHHSRLRFEEQAPDSNEWSSLPRPQWDRQSDSTPARALTRREAKVEDEPIVSLDINLLMTLETLHRGLTLYSWLGMRFPVAFCFTKEVSAMSKRTEHAIDFCLYAIRANRRQRLEALGRERRPRQSRYARRNDPTGGYGLGGEKRYGSDGYEREPQRYNGFRE